MGLGLPGMGDIFPLYTFKTRDAYQMATQRKLKIADPESAHVRLRSLIHDVAFLTFSESL